VVAGARSRELVVASMGCLLTERKREDSTSGDVGEFVAAAA
jgi:hypothetical protein